MAFRDPPVFKAWLVYTLLSTLLGFVAGGVAGFVVGLVLTFAGYNDLEQIRMACGIVGFIAALPVSFVVFSRVIYRMIVPNI